MDELIDLFAGLFGTAVAIFCCIMLWRRRKQGTPEQAKTNKILFIVCACLAVWMLGYAFYHLGHFIMIRN